jgi:allophanate hydrolase
MLVIQFASNELVGPNLMKAVGGNRMADAVFKVHFAGPLISFQDGGRFGHMRFGVPASGPMDRLSHAAGNVVLGNEAAATSIEISMGGIVLECVSGTVSLSLNGGGFDVRVGDQTYTSRSVFNVSPGDKVTVRAGGWGSWCYLGFAGHVDVPSWLSSTATHTMSGFGGGMVQSGQTITIKETRVEESRIGEIASLTEDLAEKPIRLCLGPQDQHFHASAIAALLGETFQLTDAYDRMGARLSGSALELKDALSIPSEPILRGSIQVAGDGVPTVLLADHQTTGGYPKIATVVSTDLDRLAQKRARDSISFEQVSAQEAVVIARSKALQMKTYLQEMAVPRGTLLERLMRENLISGAVGPGAD